MTPRVLVPLVLFLAVGIFGALGNTWPGLHLFSGSVSFSLNRPSYYPLLPPNVQRTQPISATGTAT